MFPEYRPSYYIDLNAENSNTYHSENRNESEPVFVSDDGDAVFDIPGRGVSVRISAENFSGISTVKQRTTVANKGAGPVVVDALSAIYLCGIGAGLPVTDDRFVIHYAHTAWQGEAQWRHKAAADMGLYKTFNHGSHTNVSFSSTGTWTTSRYLPVVMIEDTVLGKTWVFTSESGSGWTIDISLRGEGENVTLAVFVSAEYETNDGWYVKLEPGESYTTCAATCSYVEGGFEEAAGELTKYYREAFRACGTDFKNGFPPLCFNDYMNCIWALPTREKSLPLIDAAAEAGAEYYVMDAGWFGNSRDWSASLGDWEINEELFGEEGLAGIFRYVESKGMKPGIWLEIESASARSEFAKNHPELVLKRHGMNIGGDTVFADFRTKEVWDRTGAVIDKLYSMGVRFIKNDYNRTSGIGIDPRDPASEPAPALCSEDSDCVEEKPERSLAENLAEYVKCFRAFIDSVREKYPDLIIENCGSGAMRSDMGTLAHFHLQSVSDQEDFRMMPSIVSGSEVAMPPERCGIWAYPYPSPIYDRMTFERPASFTERYADGREIAYNMVTGLMGLMYLSGRIDRADENGKKLIKEACAIYKKNRAVAADSVPVYPAGTFDMTKKGIVTFGLLSRERGKLLLACWRQDETENNLRLDLSKYGDTFSVDLVYPKLAGTGAAIEGTTLNVSLPGPCSAAYIGLSVSEKDEAMDGEERNGD